MAECPQGACAQSPKRGGPARSVARSESEGVWVVTEEVVVYRDALREVRRRVKIIFVAVFFVMVPVLAFTWICTGSAGRWIDALGHYHSACTISGYCTLMAVASSLWLVASHLTCYTNPPIQQRIIRILLMVPIYACQSWLAIIFKEHALYLDLLRDTYESFAIYEFFALLKLYMGGDAECYAKLRRRPPMRHLFPLGFLPPFRTGSCFLRTVYICLLQYVVVKPLTALIAMVLHSRGLYTDGDLSFQNGYLWITLLVNCSVAVAFTSLVYFYVATRDLLVEHSPTSKFIIVKSVVFLSFWQSVAVVLLVKGHVIQPISSWSQDEVGSGLQEFLICVEMMFISIACHFGFSYNPYRPPMGSVLPSPLLVSHAVSPRIMVKGYVSDVVRIWDGQFARSGTFAEDYAEYAENISYGDQYGSPERVGPRQQPHGFWRFWPFWSSQSLTAETSPSESRPIYQWGCVIT